MDYLQDHVTTLHNLTDAVPAAPVSDSAVVVPIAGDTEGAVTPTHVFETLAAVGPSEVIVPLRSPPEVASAFADWTAGFDVPITVLWCNNPTTSSLLDDHGLHGEMGKGRDVWLGVGVAASRADYVAVHDADATTYSEAHVPRLLAPLAMEYEFVKGYYARVENGQLFGRLARLFVEPLLAVLEDRHGGPLLSYLRAFRYPLAGEFAFTAETAREIRWQRTWGLELGMLGEMFDTVGPDGTAQVDLGIHQHDHRPVTGRGGLSTMAEQVGQALFRVLEDNGYEPAYETIPEAYRMDATRLVEQYAADAQFNRLTYDRDDERSQIDSYASSITPPGRDRRLPAWSETSLSPAAVERAAAAALKQATGGSVN